MNKKIILLLRGHERNSFKNNKLNKFIYNLEQSFGLIDIVLHTWNFTEANKSWRQLSNKTYILNKTDVQNYFKKNITKIIIDDDLFIDIKGKKNTKIGSMPIKSWKRMWYGQKRAIDHIETFACPDSYIINMRIDFFECPTTNKYNIDENTIFERIKIALNSTKIIFIKDSAEYDGIDNLYIARFSKMKNIIYHFHFNLDTFINKYSYLLFHENMVFYESRLLDGENISLNLFEYYSQVAKNQLHSNYIQYAYDMSELIQNKLLIKE